MMKQSVSSCTRPLRRLCVRSRGRFHTSSRRLSSFQYKWNVHRSSKTKRDINFALAGGILLAASYIFLTKNKLFLDSSRSLTSDGATLISQQRSLSGTAATSGPYDKSNLKQMLTDEEVDRRLRAFEESYTLKNGRGVSRYDVCQLPSNNPIEDARAEKVIQVPIEDSHGKDGKSESYWYFWSVFDGHGGWNTSQKLSKELTNAIIKELANSAYKITHDDLHLIPSSGTIDRAIKNGFVQFDHKMVIENVQEFFATEQKDKSAAMKFLLPALSGSCALMSFYDTHTKNLKVAVSGDSRALLGSVNDKGVWTVKCLSIDQTGRNPSEVARLHKEHPDEPNVVRNGRILGSLEPTRAMGDGKYKWGPELQQQLGNMFFGGKPLKKLKSAPYVTAEPVVTTHEIHPEKHDFLVLGSDGLYEMLSNEDIVALVVKWMENRNMIKIKRPLLGSLFSKNDDSKLPKVIDVSDPAAKAEKKPFRQFNKKNSKEYLLEDENVATHLIRNALSNGGYSEYVKLLLSISSPVSRRYRDDLTATVVFFSDEDSEISGETQASVEINPDATRGGLDQKLKSKI